MQEPQSYSYSSTPHALSPDKLKKKSKYRNVPKEEGRGEDIYLDSRVASGRGSGNVPGKGSQYNVSKSMDIPPQGEKETLNMFLQTFSYVFSFKTINSEGFKSKIRTVI